MSIITAMKSTLYVDPQSGLLSSIPFRPSPHHDARPHEVAIDMIVVHSISLPPGEFNTPAVEAFFTGQLDMESHPYYSSIAHLKVSAHLFIKRDGTILQFVPFIKRAWHAGESAWEDKVRCNDFSIGIELEGTDDVPYEPIQYEQLAATIKALQTAYPAIKNTRIVGHADIAPGRKTDPGPHFDWNFLKGMLT